MSLSLEDFPVLSSSSVIVRGNVFQMVQLWVGGASGSEPL